MTNLFPSKRFPSLSKDDASVKAASTCPTYYLLSRREKYVWGLKPSPRQGILKWPDVFCDTFKAIRKRLGIPDPDEERPGMVAESRSDDSDLCHDMLSKYGFTEDQMHHAAERFHLGCSKSGKAIYWMIDDLGRVNDGHIGTTWVSSLLKLRYPENAKYIQTNICFFGLHQISSVDLAGPESEGRTIGIVESERSAVILSEVYPSLLWLAHVTKFMFIDRFEPLQGRTVTLFPRTDTNGEYYWAALDLADRVKRSYKTIDIHVSSFLEDHASDSQKSRQIDLVDYLFE